MIVTNLERYPAEAFALLDEAEWESIVKSRHERTRPSKGKGGLDGTGRMTPAVGDKFLSEVEAAVPLLAQSETVDKLVWKDVVEHRFRVGGLSRPKGLLFPWPVLEARMEAAGNALLNLVKKDTITDENKRSALNAIRALSESSMNISLLKSSGIGKSVKKFLKACSSNEGLQYFDEPFSSQNVRETPRTKLESTLQSWMAMAANSGVEIKGTTKGDSSAGNDHDEDPEAAKNCQTWRDLFTALKENDENRRSNQGAKMRERRQKLDSVRPKIVKVRQASSRQNSMLDRQQGSTSTSGNSKLSQLRMEAAVTYTRRSPPPPIRAKTVTATGAGFGAAVAFASGQKTGKRKAAPAAMVQLAGGKRMKIPDTKKARTNLKQRLMRKGGPLPPMSRR
jgi:hypothetical protein